MPPLRSTSIRPVLNRLSPQVEATDAEALRRFARNKDGDAFALLVRRYGPLVNGVCRRVLGPRPDADDAGQATFWILARKAGSIRDANTLPAWLHAVAYRTARKAAARSAPPPAHSPTPVSPDDPLADASWREVRQLLDAEVHRLPPGLKLPVLLCYFEDLTRDEAAVRLGWSLSTVKRRLDQARARLKDRLIRRGVGPGLLGGTALLGNKLRARVPPALEAACVRLAYEPAGAAVRSLAIAAPRTAGRWLAAAVAVVGLGWGIVTIAGQGQATETKAPPADVKEKAAPTTGVNEPLPSGAVARFGTTRYRADSGFWFASFSKDGRWMVSGTDGVELWDLDTGLRTQLMPIRHNTVPRPTLSRDGSLVAVLDGGTGVHLFDRQTGKAIKHLGAGQKFDGCHFTPDGKRVIAVTHGAAPTATGFDVADGKQVFAAKHGESSDHTAGVWDGRVVFLMLGRGPAEGGKRPPLRVWAVDAETRNELKAFDTAATDYYEEDRGGRLGGGFQAPPGSNFGPNRFAVAPDLSRLAYTREDSAIAVAPAGAGRPYRVELPATGGAGRPYYPSRFWFGPDGKDLFVSDFSGTIARCDAATGKLVATVPGHRQGMGNWHFDAAAKVMTTAGQDGLIRRWDLTTNKEVPLAPGFRAAVRAVFSADGTRVVVGDRTGVIDVYEAGTGKRLHELPRPTDGADWCTFTLSPDGRTLAATRPDGTTLWWDIVAGKEVATVPIGGPKPDQAYNSVDAMTFSPDGRRLAYGHPNGGLALVDVATRKEVWRIGFPTDPPGVDYAKGLTVSADGRRVARSLRVWDRTGGRLAHLIQVVDAETGRQVSSVVIAEGKYGTGDFPDVADLRYTPDGRYLAVLVRNGKVQFRHADTLAEVSAWTVGSRDVLAFEVSPDGRFVLTGDGTGATTLWETATGKRVLKVARHRGHVYSAALAPDARLLLTGGYDHVAYVWDLKPTARPDRTVESLSGDSAERAWEAVWALAADPDGPKLLRERVRPAEGPKSDAVQGWIADLDHPTFARREAATAALTKAGTLCEPAVWRALQGKLTAEVRERLEKVLAGIPRKPSREDVTHIRAVQALELAGTEAARKVLEEWAAGAEGAWLTTDARAALQRLKARTAAGSGPG